MNDRLGSSFSGFRGRTDGSNFVDIEMPSAATVGGGVNLDKFFQDVEGIKDELKQMETLHQLLQQSHEESKTLHNAKSVKALRSRMDSDVTAALKKAKIIKVRLEAIDRANAAIRSLPGCGAGSSCDRTCTSVVSGLRKKLKNSMDGFNKLREQILGEYRETVERRCYMVTGEKPDEQTIDGLISTGQSETFLQKQYRTRGGDGYWTPYQIFRRGMMR